MRAAIQVLALAWIGSGIASSATHVVRPNGTGDFPTIQAAIDAAAPGDNIALTDGTFQGPGNRDIDLRGKAIAVASQSGSPETCIVDCAQSGRGFLLQSGEGPDTVLRGVSVTNGQPSASNSGGALYCDHTSPTLIDCSFQGNTADQAGAGAYFLGSSSTLNGCTFEDNVALGDGGGIYADQSTLNLTACSFIGNQSRATGGAIACRASALDLQACSFAANVAHDSGGGIASSLGSSAAVEQSEFTNNRAELDDGGAASSVGSTLSLVSSTFIDNQASGSGGAVFSDGTDRLEGCVFRGNAANQDGGGAWIQAGPPTLQDCVFFDNTAGNGAGLYGSALTGILTGCTFAGNLANFGGAMYLNHGTPELRNCTLHGNAAAYGAGILSADGSATLTHCIVAFGVSAEGIGCLGGSGPAMTCCDLYGNEGGDWVGCVASQFGSDGNLAEDPLFCAALARDFSLEANSPCAPFNPENPDCDLIGAWPAGCGPSSIPEDPDRPGIPSARVNWGALKALYR